MSMNIENLKTILNAPRLLGYDQITLVPRIASDVASRSDVETKLTAFDSTFLPIVSSPMPDITGGLLAGKLSALGGLGIIHRFLSIPQQIDEYRIAVFATQAAFAPSKNIACAIGVTGDYLERYEALYNEGCRIFCLDTANGFNSKTKDAVLAIRLKYEGASFLIAGNVATREGYSYLAETGVDAVRVGIAGGSVCTTRLETGVFVPMATSVAECVSEKRLLEALKLPAPLVIADGGIKAPNDLCKALAIGADMIMSGSIFAGRKETPGTVLRDRDTDNLYKTYRGAASFSVQYEHRKERPEYTEGEESFVPYKEDGVTRVMHRFEMGLRSSMSYMNALTLNQYPQNTCIQLL
jgi:IMP dehydrogenase